MKISEVASNMSYKGKRLSNSKCPWDERFVPIEKYHFWEEGNGRATMDYICIKIGSGACQSCYKTDSNNFKMLTKELRQKNNVDR